MKKPFKKKIAWSIHNFFTSEDHHSDKFVVGGCKWSLCAYRVTHDNDDYLVMVLVVAGNVSLLWAFSKPISNPLSMILSALGQVGKLSRFSLLGSFPKGLILYGVGYLLYIRQFSSNIPMWDFVCFPTIVVWMEKKRKIFFWRFAIILVSIFVFF